MARTTENVSHRGTPRAVGLIARPSRLMTRGDNDVSAARTVPVISIEPRGAMLTEAAGKRVRAIGPLTVKIDPAAAR